jgi:hypothetical protein
MAFIARWSIDVKFGHKDEAITSFRKWQAEVGAKLGWKTRALTGSIGVLESRMETEITVESLADLESAWAKLGTNEIHKRWGKEIEPLVVSGTNGWEIFRIVEV